MRIALLALPALFLTGLACTPADARARRVIEGDYVVAESRFGNGTITGAVRNTSLGPQVQLPSGHWEYCRRSCSETLRVETIDFNENNAQWVGGGGLANECGIFGCLELGFSWRR
ncbi:MAG TPA: hypothetical protein PKD49_03145 [Hyphomicrobium sp.]|nr:hypothetical protein [Hyphomicrobium sp.]